MVLGLCNFRLLSIRFPDQEVSSDATTASLVGTETKLNTIPTLAASVSSHSNIYIGRLERWHHVDQVQSIK